MQSDISAWPLHCFHAAVIELIICYVNFSLLAPPFISECDCGVIPNTLILKTTVEINPSVVGVK